MWICIPSSGSLELYLVHGIPLLACRHMGLHNWVLWGFTYALAIPMAILLYRFFNLLKQNPR